MYQPKPQPYFGLVLARYLKVGDKMTFRISADDADTLELGVGTIVSIEETPGPRGVILLLDHGEKQYTRRVGVDDHCNVLFNE